MPMQEMVELFDMRFLFNDELPTFQKKTAKKTIFCPKKFWPYVVLGGVIF